MLTRDEWRQTEVHRASSYFCDYCGARLACPHDVLRHIASVHGDAPDRGYAPIRYHARLNPGRDGAGG